LRNLEEGGNTGNNGKGTGNSVLSSTVDLLNDGLSGLGVLAGRLGADSLSHNGSVAKLDRSAGLSRGDGSSGGGRNLGRAGSDRSSGGRRSSSNGGRRSRSNGSRGGGSSGLFGRGGLRLGLSGLFSLSGLRLGLSRLRLGGLLRSLGSLGLGSSSRSLSSSSGGLSSSGGRGSVGVNASRLSGQVALSKRLTKVLAVVVPQLPATVKARGNKVHEGTARRAKTVVVRALSGLKNKVTAGFVALHSGTRKLGNSLGERNSGNSGGKGSGGDESLRRNHF